MREDLNEGNEGLEPWHALQFRKGLDLTGQLFSIRQFADVAGYEVVRWYIDTCSHRQETLCLYRQELT